jgi:formylglycine-generating enzyme required for sulfatase activity
VTWAEAERCAAWLGGKLPTPGQLDLAAGCERRDGREGPARGPRVAVNRRAEGPRPVDDPASDDVSPCGVRDLAGNGREWTRDFLWAGGEKLAVLRGWSFTAPRPLRFADLDLFAREDRTPTQYPTHASPTTGFRVVIEIP